MLLSSTKTVLMMPAIPAAPSKCLMFVFTAPLGNGQVSSLFIEVPSVSYTRIGSSLSLTCLKMFPIAIASKGSPIAVPVPWASK
jgi:hypothetical protein